jgi:hypothetical protein
MGPSILLNIFLSYEFIIFSAFFVMTHVSLPYINTGRITVLYNLTLSTPRAKFTLAYQLAGRKLVNEDNLLKLHGHLLTVQQTHYYKQVHTACHSVTVIKSVVSDTSDSVLALLKRASTKQCMGR